MIAFFRKLATAWKQDSLGDTAAALTYYGVLALFPFLLFAVTVAGLLLDPHAITQIVAQANRVLPGPVANIIGERLTALQENASGGLLTFGILAALWAASGGISSLGEALNRCYHVRETRPYWRWRGNAIVVTLVASLAGVLAVATMFFLPMLGRRLGGVAGSAITWLRFPVAGLVVLGLWAFFYWSLPNVRARFRLITPGSLIGAALWLTASWAFSEYVGRWGKYDAVYGALGGVIVFLIWMWLSSVVVLLGAEINQILTLGSSTSRSRAVPRPGGSEPSPVT